MADLKLSVAWIALIQFLSLVAFSNAKPTDNFNYTQSAFYMSENNCNKLTDETTAGPILFTAAHVILVAKTMAVKDTYGPSNRRYSVTAMPQCIMKGDTTEKEIVVRNLGASACGPSDVEFSKDYLFFLRKTADPKVFETVNTGAKALKGPLLWSPIFTLFCGIARIEKCAKGTCPMACSYKIPGSNSCIPPKQTVYDTYKQLYPEKLTTKAPMTVTEKGGETMVTTMAPKKDDMAKKPNETVTYAPKSGKAVKVTNSKGSGNGQETLKTDFILLISLALSKFIFSH